MTQLRQSNIDRMTREHFDVLIIGGGINGAVSAAALAARGAKVALIDARDFAGFTSQQSSNLVWGGIKYMESYEFGLVSNLCKSRNELLRSFPSTVKEIRFLTTLQKNFRFHPLLMLAGTWLYWLLGRGRTRTPKLLSAAQIKALEPKVNTADSIGGIEYSDAYLHDNDARFVFNFVRRAMERGCAAANYVKSLNASRDADGSWLTTVEDQQSGQSFEIRSRVLINAAGAFVDQYNQMTGIRTDYHHLFSKGIHLIVPQLSREKRVLAFFADDGRLFFAIPMANRTCIGTTDTIVEDPVTHVTDADRAFVLSNINARLKLERPLTEADVIAERCGVRPLAIRKGQDSQQDFLQLSRKHVIEVDQADCHISIFGGKLTDCLNVGEEICDNVAELGIALRPASGKWYGEPEAQVQAGYRQRAAALGLNQVSASDTGEKLIERLWRRYGEHALTMLDAIEQDARMAEVVIEGTGVRRCELDYLAGYEMVVKLEDYLRRRSKLEMLLPRERLKASRGVLELCQALFGDEAQLRFDEYFGEQGKQSTSRVGGV